VKSGDVIAEIETDKATMEVEAVDEGKVADILIAEGTENVKVNTPIATILGDGEARPGAGAKPPSTPARPADSPAPAVVRGALPPSWAAPDPDIPAGTEMAPMTVREALRDAMREEMKRDANVFLIGEEVGQYQGAYKVSQGLLDEFGPKRIVDTPITEMGFAGLATGAAFAGLRPIVEFMTFNFAMQAIDHIINSATKTLYMSGGQLGCPIVFRGPNGAAARVAAQHSHDFSAWYSQVPGLKVVAPYSSADAKGLLKSAIRDGNPVIFLENEILYGKTFDVPKLDDWVVPIGKARVARVGRHVTIVSFGIGMTYALSAADRLASEGIEAEVIDLRSLRPMDIHSVVESVRKTNRCVTVEEGWPQGSIGSEIAAQLMTHAFDYLDAPVARVTGKDVPMPYAANLEKLALPNADDVVAAAKSTLYV
jgi:pyruvate dehydrogenase E1 component beta subunit